MSPGTCCDLGWLSWQRAANVRGASPVLFSFSFAKLSLLLPKGCPVAFRAVKLPLLQLPSVAPHLLPRPCPPAPSLQAVLLISRWILARRWRSPLREVSSQSSPAGARRWRRAWGSFVWLHTLPAPSAAPPSFRAASKLRDVCWPTREAFKKCPNSGNPGCLSLWQQRWLITSSLAVIF